MSNLEAVSAFVQGAPPGEVRYPRSYGRTTNQANLEQLNDVVAGKDNLIRANTNNRINKPLARYQAAHLRPTATGRAARAGLREVQ